ncbi:MAG: response regulator [Pseudomonadales bacterium]|nr:response regulator [Pseudomonadales bacterium]
MKLVIVDDSNIIRSRIARIGLNPMMQGITIVGMAKDGHEALEICRRHQPDVVTMDLTMPNMDGTECIELLINLQPSINILVVSALSDKATAIDALMKGAQGFLYKPFTDEQLINALIELVE